MRPLCIYDHKSLDSVAAAAVVKHFEKDAELLERKVTKKEMRGRQVYSCRSEPHVFEVAKTGRVLWSCTIMFKGSLAIGMWQYFSSYQVPKFLSELAGQELGDLKPESPVWEELLK